MLRNFHKTTSGHWQRISGTQKGSPFSPKGGRTKYKRQIRDKREGQRPGLRRELWRRRSFQTSGNPLTGGSVGNFGISEGNITGREKKQKQANKQKTECAPNHNSQRRSSPDACVSHQRAGPEHGGAVCMLRIRTQPEYHENNLGELTCDSNPNCGIARERGEKKKTQRTFPWKTLT